MSNISKHTHTHAAGIASESTGLTVAGLGKENVGVTVEAEYFKRDFVQG